MQCAYCTKTFSTVTTLRRHQQTAQYCIRIREKVEKVDDRFVCVCCGKELSSKQRLQTHNETCMSKKLLTDRKEIELKLKLKEDENEWLRKQVEKKPTHVTKTINKSINILLPITEEYMKGCVDLLTIEHLKAGAQGIAKFVGETMLKNRILCTDVSSFFLVNHEKVPINNETLCKNLFTILKSKVCIMVNDYQDDLDDEELMTSKT